MNKTIQRYQGKREKAIYMGWVWKTSLQACWTRL